MFLGPVPSGLGAGQEDDVGGEGEEDGDISLPGGVCLEVSGRGLYDLNVPCMLRWC